MERIHWQVTNEYVETEQVNIVIHRATYIRIVFSRYLKNNNSNIIIYIN